MPVPSLITDLSTTAASNSPAGGDNPRSMSNYMRAMMAFVAQIRDDTGTGSTTKFYKPSSTSLAMRISGTDHVTCDSSGRLLNSSNSRPAFAAYRSSFQTSGDANNVLVFDTEEFDQGGVYNNSTGVFTAPVDGMYLLAACVTVSNDGSNATWYFDMTKNSASLMKAYIYAPTIQTVRATLIKQVRLTAGNTVDIRSQYSLSSVKYLHGSSHQPSFFSGCLLG